MTERRGSVPVVALAGALFCVLLTYLALQVRAGGDPAIGAGQQRSTAQAPRKILVRRVIVTRVIEQDTPAAPAGGGAMTPVSAPADSASTGRAAPAPAPAAPAPPAPAPVVSSAS